jgi:hypothetical protein
MPTKPVAKKPIPGKPQAVKPAQKNVVQKKPAPDKAKGLALWVGIGSDCPEAVQSLQDKNIDLKKFASEPVGLDGFLAHAV